MKTISLRYMDKFAPKNGTVDAHKKILEEKGYVWYGKLGTPISDKVSKMILNNLNPRFLLIHSGAPDRYWIYIDKISHECPPYDDFPSYYRDFSNEFKTWFRVIKIEHAEKNVISKCTVASSGTNLSIVSHHSMSPYFVIDYVEE